MATTSFSLGEEWDAYLAEKVASGDFKTKAEVVRNALLWQRERELAISRFHAFVQEGLDSPTAGRFDADMIAGIKAEAEKRLNTAKKSA